MGLKAANLIKLFKISSILIKIESKRSITLIETLKYMFDVHNKHIYIFYVFKSTDLENISHGVNYGELYLVIMIL